MGYYVNPPLSTKEDFLADNGVIVPFETKWNDIPKDCLPVMWVNNGPFTAAAIGFNPKELDAFREPKDNRPKKLFVVEKSKLKEIGCEWPE